jgi:hypothetical protein
MPCFILQKHYKNIQGIQQQQELYNTKFIFHLRTALLQRGINLVFFLLEYKQQKLFKQTGWQQKQGSYKKN